MAKKDTFKEDLVGSLIDKGGPGDEELNQSQRSDSLQNLLGHSDNSKNMKDLPQLAKQKSGKTDKQDGDKPDQVKQNSSIQQEDNDLLLDILKNSDQKLDSGQSIRNQRNKSDLLNETHQPLFQQQDASSNPLININSNALQQEISSVQDYIQFEGTKELVIDNQVSEDEDGYYLSESSDDEGKRTRYRDRDHQPKKQKVLEKIYEQQREEVISRSNFFSEMQTANSFFNDKGFMKFNSDSRRIRLEEKGFYYVFDNKLFVLMRKKKKVSKILTQLNVETQSINLNEHVPESEKRVYNIDSIDSIDSGDKIPKDDGNDLNYLFLEMIAQQKYVPLYFKTYQSDKYKECQKYLSVHDFDQYIDRQIQESNFVISIYQMPELSHIQDVETGLEKVSKKTKLFVRNVKNFVLYDKYCAIHISHKKDLNISYQKQINRNIFLIDTNNKDFNSEYDRIIGLTTKLNFNYDRKQIMIFMKQSHVLLGANTQFTKDYNYCSLNNLYDDSGFVQQVTLDKVYCCLGNIGVGIHFDYQKDNEDYFSRNKNGFTVLIDHLGSIKQKKPCEYFKVRKICRQRVQEFFTQDNTFIRVLSTVKSVIANRKTFQRFESEKDKNYTNERYDYYYSTISSQNDNEFETDQPLQGIIHYKEKEKMQMLIIIDFINTTLQAISFEYNDKLPKIGLINNKNFILNTGKGSHLQNIYLGDARITGLSNNGEKLQITPDEIIQNNQIYETKFLHFNKIYIPLQNHYRKKQICKSFMKTRIFTNVDVINNEYSWVQFSPSMKRISVMQIGIVINENYVWNFELDKEDTSKIIFTKSEINFKDIYERKIVKSVKISISQNNKVDFCTISSDLKHIFYINDDNQGYIQRLQINDNEKIMQFQYTHEFKDTFNVLSFSKEEVILIRFSHDIITKRFNLHLEKYSYRYDDLNSKGYITLLQTIQLSRYNRLWDINGISYENCIIKDKKSKENLLLRYGDYNFIFHQYLIIQQMNEVLVFIKETFEFKGCYSFYHNVRKIKVFDNQLYIDCNKYHRELILQGKEDLFTFLSRINPESLNTIVKKDLKELTYLNADDEIIGYVPFNNGNEILRHKSLFKLKVLDKDILEYINNLDEIQLSLDLGYNQENYDGTFAHILANRPNRQLQFFQKRLYKFNNKNLPKFFRKNIKDLTPFDIVKENKDIQSMIILLDIMLKIQNHTVYNYLVDPHINYLIEKRVNLEEYFNSNLPISQIKNKSYLEYSTSSSTIIHSDFDQNQSVNYIMRNYDDIFKNVILNNDGSAIQVEYFLVNIPQTMQTFEFIQNLSQINDLDIFETQCIQIILDYKWDTYTNKFFLMQFTIFILFIVAYITDLYFFVIQGNERELSQQLIVKLVCAGTLLVSGSYEIILMRKQTLQVYIQEGWNIFDLSMIFHYFIILVIDVQNAIPEGIVILQGVMLMLIFVKLCQILRIFKGFSYQVTMLQAVFYDIKYFILLYVSVIFMYGLIFTLLRIQTSEENDDYDGINLFGYFIMAFRASTGDFQVDQFKQLQDEHIIYGWIIWISAVLFLNIILLNFIIAVISESYEKVMQKMIAESYRIKCQLIKERELFFDNKDLNDAIKFPRYLILRKPVSQNEDSNSEWQGFVKDIKKSLIKVSQTIQLDNESKHQTTLDQFIQLTKEHNIIKQDISQQNEKFTKITDQLNEQKQQFSKITDQLNDLKKCFQDQSDKPSVLLQIQENKIEEQI
eukprot:403349528